MISVELKPSYILALLLAAAHSGAIFLILALPISYQPILVLLLLANMIHSIMHHALRLFPASPSSLRIGEKSCTLYLRNGREIDFSFAGNTYVSPSLTVLNFREAGSHFIRSVVILPDCIERESFRRLRVRLKWK